MKKQTMVHKEDDDRNGYYLCIHAVGEGNPKKLTDDWTKVTCKNCLKICANNEILMAKRELSKKYGVSLQLMDKMRNDIARKGYDPFTSSIILCGELAQIHRAEKRHKST